MVSPVPPVSDRESEPLAAAPVAIRACLSSALVAELDREWEIALERAQQAKDLAPVRDPGPYYRLLAKAEQITHIGHNPDAGSFEDIQALIQRRLSR